MVIEDTIRSLEIWVVLLPDEISTMAKLFRVLHCFYTENLLETHMPDCGTHGLQVVRYPTPGRNILKFTNIQNKFEVGFCIYADFESFLINTDEIDPTKSTHFFDTHEPSGFGCLTVSSIAKYNKCKPVIYNGPRVMKRFFSHLRQEQVRINRILSKNKRMNL